jgi:hypothetical protein
VTSAAFLAVILLAVGVVGGFAYLSYLQAKKRRLLLQSFAAGEGWTWVQEDDSWTERFTGNPFGEGDHRHAANVLTGAFRTRQMVAFDYSYETHSTDGHGNSSTTTHRYAVCALSLPGSLPRFELVPEHVLGRLGTMLGMQDIELESEDFNRRFRVRCEDPKLAYAILPARTMELLLARPALHLRLAGADAICWENGGHSPAQLLARLDTLSQLLDGIPPFVWTDLKGSSS